MNPGSNIHPWAQTIEHIYVRSWAPESQGNNGEGLYQLREANKIFFFLIAGFSCNV